MKTFKRADFDVFKHQKNLATSIGNCFDVVLGEKLLV